MAVPMSAYESMLSYDEAQMLKHYVKDAGFPTKPLFNISIVKSYDYYRDTFSYTFYKLYAGGPRSLLFTASSLREAADLLVAVLSLEQ